LRAEVPIYVIFVHTKCNMVSATIPARNVLLRANAIVHLPFDREAAEPLVEVGPATVVVTLGRAGFVIVKAVELCALVGVADVPWLERVTPGSNELKLAGGSVDYIITPHQPLHSSPTPN
jgi:hypothetical protein